MKNLRHMCFEQKLSAGALNRVLNAHGQFAIFKKRRQRSFVKRGAWNELGGRTPLSIGNGSG